MRGPCLRLCRPRAPAARPHVRRPQCGPGRASTDRHRSSAAKGRYLSILFLMVGNCFCRGDFSLQHPRLNLTGATRGPRVARGLNGCRRADALIMASQHAALLLQPRAPPPSSSGEYITPVDPLIVVPPECLTGRRIVYIMIYGSRTG